MEDDLQITPQSLLATVVIVGLISVPLMLLIVVVIIMINSWKDASRQTRYMVYTLIGLTLGYINTTKPTGYSDLAYYYWLYNWADTKSFIEYIVLIPKEPLYHIYNYLMRSVTFGSFSIFMIVTTVLMYFPVMVAFDRLVRENGIPLKYAVAAAVILGCFSEYFFYTAQIVRQVLAGSLAFYFVVRMAYERDIWSYIGLACCGFIHASAFIFCVYYILQFTMNWKLRFRVSAIIVSFLLFGMIVSAIASLGDADSTLAYAAMRAQGEVNEIKINIGALPLAVCFSVIPMSLMIMWKLNWEKRVFNIFLLGIFLVGFVFANIGNPLFVLRFMEYCYMFIPICLVMSLYLAGLGKIAYLAMAVILIRFGLNLNKGDFHYDSIGSICTEGFFSIILKFIS